MEEIHMGKLIKMHLKQKGIKMQWLCEQMHCHRNTMYGILERSWIDSYTLMRISIILNHDFFAELSAYYADSKEHLKNSDVE